MASLTLHDEKNDSVFISLCTVFFFFKHDKNAMLFIVEHFLFALDLLGKFFICFADGSSGW